MFKEEIVFVLNVSVSWIRNLMIFVWNGIMYL